MSLGSIHPLTEMSTRNLPGGTGRPEFKADNLTAICEPIVKKMWEARRLANLWASAACYRDSFTFFIIYISENGRFLAFSWLMKQNPAICFEIATLL
jgi:hypothetical protein